MSNMNDDDEEDDKNFSIYEDGAIPVSQRDVKLTLSPNFFVPKEKGDWVVRRIKKLESEGKGWDSAELQAEYDRRKKDGTLNDV